MARLIWRAPAGQITPGQFGLRGGQQAGLSYQVLAVQPDGSFWPQAAARNGLAYRLRLSPGAALPTYTAPSGTRP